MNVRDSQRCIINIEGWRVFHQSEASHAISIPTHLSAHLSLNAVWTGTCGRGVEIQGGTAYYHNDSKNKSIDQKISGRHAYQVPPLLKKIA